MQDWNAGDILSGKWHSRPSSDGNPNHLSHTKVTSAGEIITAHHLNDPWSHTIGFKKYAH